MAIDKFDIGNDRRHYFRIDDVSLLQYTVVEDDAVASEDDGYQLRRKKLMLKARLETMTREMQPLHKMIAAKNSKVAQYLSMLDRKLDQLADCMVSSEIAEMRIESTPVNIGAGGLSFMNGSPIMNGTLLEVQLVLLPENNAIISYARVVNCAKIDIPAKEKKQYKIAIEFEGLDEEVRDLISRHVIARDIEAVAGRRDSD
ncbi:MAG TPA: PilZ domain-containing protein [Thiotrichales bacterium]|nr:PilZ domain-containing protein [Thiotrichales bacterium]